MTWRLNLASIFLLYFQSMRILLLLLISVSAVLNAQNMFQSIPSYDDIEVSESAILMRMIDGLGFRYYWASEGLTQDDLVYKISEDSRSTEETLFHIYQLSNAILNFTLNKANSSIKQQESLKYPELRLKTLENLESAHNILSKLNSDQVAQLTVQFERSGFKEPVKFPIWNIINGQISDALYHTGQIVSFRRASGNPINSNISVFTGTVRP